MKTWDELRAEFDGCKEGIQFYRIDYQYGDGPSFASLAGGNPSTTSRRFELIAEIAGAKLLELPEGVIESNILAIGSDKDRWYEALKALSGEYEGATVGRQIDAYGADLGFIYIGSIAHPAEASSNLILKLLPSIKERAGMMEPLMNFINNENEKRGLLWKVIMCAIAFAMPIISLIFD